MGSICGIHRNPKYWTFEEKGRLKNDGREIGEAVIGWYDDYDCSDLAVWMLKEHYDAIQSGKIKFTPFPYSEKMLELTDLNGNEICPIQINGTYLY